MAASFARPLTHPKRVKLVSTCDSCKNRKVRCDKERPCGACKKSNKVCSYEYSLMSIAIRENGGRARLEEKLNSLQSIQEKRIDQPQNFIYMALRDYGVDVHAPPQEVPSMPGQQNMSTIPPNLDQMPHFPPSTDLAESVLQHSTRIASQLQRTEEQYQYDPTYFLNSADFAVLAQQVSTATQPQIHFSPDQNIQNHQMSIADLALAFEELNLYQSTRYIGEGSLLLIGDHDDNHEKFIPQPEQGLSDVTAGLKVLPDHFTVNDLVSLYYKHLHRYAPFLRRTVVNNALKNLSKPQHLLLLNCIFFAASPFNDDPQKRDGRVYFERAEGLLYKYCRTQPHVLTVMATILLGLHNKQPVSGWMYNGIATKMLFELGLHRKMKNVKIKLAKEVAKLRSEAFWMTFISENFVSAAYGRPNMIEESDCDVDLPELPLHNPPNEETRLQIAFHHWVTLSRICVRVRKYLHAASRMKFLVQEDENKFRFLDTQLGSWLVNLPDWLRFQNMVNEYEGSLLNGIGGDLNIFYFTVLILLHSRHLRPSGVYVTDTAHQSNSLMICTQAARIIVMWLDTLLEKCPDFFSHSICGPLAINPALRVFKWNSQYLQGQNSQNDNDMVSRLGNIEARIFELARKYDRGREHDIALEESNYVNDWLGLYPHRKSVDEGFDISQREGEVFIADNDYATRSQYRFSWRQGSFGFGRRRPTRGMSANTNGTQSRQMSWTSSSIAGPSRRMSSTSSKNFNRWLSSEGRFDLQTGQPLNEEPQNIDESSLQDLNFIFMTDQKYEFSAFQQPTEVHQTNDANLFSSEPETQISYTPVNSNSYTPITDSSTSYTPITDSSIISTPSSTSEFQEQQSPPQILYSHTLPLLQLVRPQEIEKQPPEHCKNQDQSQRYLEYEQSQSQLHSQLPMTPPQQNYPDNDCGNYVNNALDSEILTPQQNFHPLRTSSNSSSMSAMLTPPLDPSEEHQSFTDLFELFDNQRLLDNPDPLNLARTTSTGNISGTGGNERGGNTVSGLGISVGQQNH